MDYRFAGKTPERDKLVGEFFRTMHRLTKELEGILHELYKELGGKGLLQDVAVTEIRVEDTRLSCRCHLRGAEFYYANADHFLRTLVEAEETVRECRSKGLNARVEMHDNSPLVRIDTPVQILPEGMENVEAGAEELTTVRLPPVTSDSLNSITTLIATCIRLLNDHPRVSDAVKSLSRVSPLTFAITSALFEDPIVLALLVRTAAAAGVKLEHSKSLSTVILSRLP